MGFWGGGFRAKSGHTCQKTTLLFWKVNREYFLWSVTIKLLSGFCDSINLTAIRRRVTWHHHTKRSAKAHFNSRSSITRTAIIESHYTHVFIARSLKEKSCADVVQNKHQNSNELHHKSEKRSRKIFSGHNIPPELLNSEVLRLHQAPSNQHGCWTVCSVLTFTSVMLYRQVFTLD